VGEENLCAAHQRQQRNAKKNLSEKKLEE